MDTTHNPDDAVRMSAAGPEVFRVSGGRAARAPSGWSLTATSAAS